MASLSRRQLLRTLATGSAALFTPALRFIAPARADSASTPTPVKPDDGYVFFTPAEIAFLDAAVARIIPADDLGPGAREAGVTLFLDRQMDGPYGRAERWYMQGPWQPGSEEQGYQLRLTPAQLYRSAIADIDAECRRSFRNRPFARLTPAQQDHMLHDLEAGKSQLAHVPGVLFFQLLVHNTVEGFFADPLYGGNRDFVGWKLIGFPGPRYNYVDFIEHYGQRYPYPTVGLLGRNGTRSA